MQHTVCELETWALKRSVSRTGAQSAGAGAGAHGWKIRKVFLTSERNFVYLCAFEPNHK